MHCTETLHTVVYWMSQCLHGNGEIFKHCFNFRRIKEISGDGRLQNIWEWLIINNLADPLFIIF